MISNKGGKMSPSILVLVFLTLILVITSLFIFAAREGGIRATIVTDNSLEEAYTKSEILDSYLRRVINETGKEEPVSGFREALSSYKVGEKYVAEGLDQVEDQVDGEHIRIEGGVLKIDFSVEFSIRSINKKDPERANYLGTYTHKFSHSQTLEKEVEKGL